MQTPIKLSELTKRVEEVIRLSFEDTYWIIAEVSGHKFYPNNDRHYFELVEKEEGKTDPIAKVRGVSWHEGSQHIKVFESATGQLFTNGLEVLVKVKLEFHSAHGFQLVLKDIDQSFTLGNLEKQRRDTLQRLLDENPDAIKKINDQYYTKNKSIKLSSVIQNIALIGSPNSEGYVDFTHTLSSNQFQYKFSIDIYQSSVQGAGAEKELVNKLIAIFESGKKFDCIVIIRGGGAKTDFLVFDTYNLARAVARFPIPIITGIGHHKDVSIVDLMVHTTTKTPTKAAEFIVAHNNEFENNIIQHQKTILIKSQQLLASHAAKINSANIVIVNKSRTFIAHYKDQLSSFYQVVTNKTKTILFKEQTQLLSHLNQLLMRPKIVTSNKSKDLDNIVENLQRNTQKLISNQKGFLTHYGSIMQLMDPKNILKKGFAIVSQKGEIVKNAEEIKEGSDLTISMYNHDIDAKVISKRSNDEQR